MTYQLYRNTTLGFTLQESLDELIQSGQITPRLASKVIQKFDRVTSEVLSTRVNRKISFKGDLKAYRYCDHVWTLILNKAEFRDRTDVLRVDKVKIVACDAGTNDKSKAAKAAKDNRA